MTMKMSRFLMLIWAVTLGMVCPQGAAAKLEPEGSQPTELGAVFGVERPRNHDLLLLRNGDKLTGRILDPMVVLEAGYAQFEFEAAHIAGIDLEAAFLSIESVVTINSNRFSGFIQNPRFAFKLENGEELSLRREALRRIVFRNRPGELAGISQSQFFRLKNGDFFTGRLLNDPLVLVTGYARIPVALSRAEAILPLPGESGLTRILLRNENVIQGMLETEDFEVALDLGFEVRIFRDRLESIAWKEGLIHFRPGEGRIPGMNSELDRDGGLGLPKFPRMALIAPGTFLMGSPVEERDRDLDEGPQTAVSITRPYWMGIYEVTQAQYQAVMGVNPSQFTGNPDRPVERVTWHEAVEYCARLTRKAIQGDIPEGYVYRLPTEAEWEYACRAGSDAQFTFGDDWDYLSLEEWAWFGANSESSTHPVGAKKPNRWGLHDMHGNVWEWCLDRWSGSLPGGEANDPVAAIDGSLRVVRGGSWLYPGKSCRSANRDDYGASNRCSDIGFRVVLAPVIPSELLRPDN